MIISLLAVCLFVVGIGIDFFQFTKNKKTLSVEYPLVIRGTVDIESVMVWKIKNSENKNTVGRIGFVFPDEVGCEERIRAIKVTKEGSVESISFTPKVRGLFYLKQCSIEIESPWRLLSYRYAIENPCEVRIYPNLRKEHRKLAQAFLRGDNGSHIIRQMGKGRDFERLREYVQGDSYNDIHWKATARRHKPITKVYQIEKTQQIYVVVDTSRLSRHDKKIHGAGASVIDVFVNASLLVTTSAQRQGDHTGLLTFDSQVNTFVKATNGKNYTQIRDSLYTLDISESSPDYREVMSYIRTNISKRSLIIFLTPLGDQYLNEEFINAVSMISRQHLVITGMIPNGEFEQLFSRPVEETEHIFDRIENHVRWNEITQLQKRCAAVGVKVLPLSLDTMVLQLISEYIQIKKRQLL